ncbi:hypothetical protein PC119_g7784 [Phytophthora cactorum]|nr:hypothetical protein PC119_g7784 [Phytophthora cactorum]
MRSTRRAAASLVLADRITTATSAGSIWPRRKVMPKCRLPRHRIQIEQRRIKPLHHESPATIRDRLTAGLRSNNALIAAHTDTTIAIAGRG